MRTIYICLNTFNDELETADGAKEALDAVRFLKNLACNESRSRLLRQRRAHAIPQNSSMPVTCTSQSSGALRPIYDLGSDGSQWAPCQGRFLDWPITISKSYTNTCGEVVRGLSFSLPLPDMDIPDSFFRELLEDSTSRGPGHWTTVFAPGKKRPGIAYEIQIPARFSPGQLEGVMRLIELSVEECYNRLAVNHPF